MDIDGHIEDRNTKDRDINSRNLDYRDKKNRVTGHMGVIEA